MVVSSKNRERREVGQSSSVGAVEGFTWRAFLAIIYTALILQPAAIYLYLVTGTWYIGALLNTTIVLFAVLAKVSGKSLSKQELWVMINSTSTAMGMEIIVAFIYNYYLRNHPVANLYGLTNLIPSWYAPPLTGPLRNLLNPLWLLPLGIALGGALLAKANDISLGFLFHHLYVEVEKLPFPMATVSAETCKSLTWEDQRKLRIFSLSAILASFYALIVYFPAIVYGFSVIPIPWIDLNNLTELILPGASFGIATDLVILVTGFILPLEVALGFFIGSFALYFVGNHLLVRFGLFPEWTPGLGLTRTWQRSLLGFWLGPAIGFLIAASVLPAIRHPRYFVKTIKDLGKLPSKRTGEKIPLNLILGFFLIGTLGSVVLTLALIPNLPISMILIILLLTVGWSFLSSMITAYAVGITAFLPQIPYVKESTFIASGYQGVGLWFAPLVISSGGASWCATFKVADLTSTRKWSLIAAHFVATFTAWIVGFFYVNAFLSISPIPSAMFPAPFWPIEAVRTITFISQPTSLINFMTMGGAFLTAALLYAVTGFLHLPVSIIAIATGAISIPVAPPMATSTLLGWIVGYFFGKKVGKKNWEMARPIIVAGVGAGEGIVIAIATFIAVVSKAIYALPF